MKASAIQIAAGVVLGTGIIALVGAHLPVASEPPPHEVAAEERAAAPAAIPPATNGAVPVPAAGPPAGAWRKGAAPPSDVPAGVLVRAASSAKRPPGAASCVPADAESAGPARPEPRPPVACTPAAGAVESVEIDWGGAPARQ